MRKRSWTLRRWLSRPALAAAIVGSLTMIGCSGDSSEGENVSFQNDLLPQFQRSCGLSGSCHSQPVRDPTVQRVFLGCVATNPGCTVMSPETVYEGLLVNSQEVSSMPYVTPGDPAQSYLLYKLEGEFAGLQCLPAENSSILQNAPGDPPPCGYSMPLNQPPLTALTQQVRAWIEQGAPNN